MADSLRSQMVLCQIATCAFEVVNRFLERDQRLSQVLRSTKTSSRQVVREESITQEIALTLKERFSDNVEMILFTAPEEKRNGADWYWRIQSGERAIHARVQAKRIQRSEFNQPDAEGTVEIAPDQLRTLVKGTRSARKTLPGLQAWISIFGRYDSTPPCGVDPCNCQNHGCGGQCDKRLIPSIWIAQADAIAKSATVRRRMRDIVCDSVRLDCVLPCIDGTGGDGPNAKGFVLAQGLLPFDECVAAIQRAPSMNSPFKGAMRIEL
jgi:hypothetical protein